MNPRTGLDWTRLERTGQDWTVDRTGLWTDLADRAHRVELDGDELSEPRRVVVPDGLGVAERFQNRVRLEQLLLQGLLVLRHCPARVRRAEVGDKLEDQLARLGFPRSGLSRDDNAL